mmetsp:Transcript_17689/g.35272  ORF Transcript_17689/g.35272 Transcript_17689/m.35272 type:complete len:740 (+) Transcript_17689:42-2261(+)|eukprot:CAMPEP_0194317888 /NCGR_PEP_ID=MMETSP0171-20130528/14571_1 /TAXON_ID=218684 /ORGANISM="Corethron pennatum, Strain L29A3" /LENGTH=739 /DNA_ID=CAMNT_0039074615 /DNA_START=39 /DNA_END=2258 /DNA_ORIENTATION=-
MYLTGVVTAFSLVVGDTNWMVNALDEEGMEHSALFRANNMNGFVSLKEARIDEKPAVDITSSVEDEFRQLELVGDDPDDAFRVQDRRKAAKEKSKKIKKELKTGKTGKFEKHSKKIQKSSKGTNKEKSIAPTDTSGMASTNVEYNPSQAEIFFIKQASDISSIVKMNDETGRMSYSTATIPWKPLKGNITNIVNSVRNYNRWNKSNQGRNKFLKSTLTFIAGVSPLIPGIGPYLKYATQLIGLFLPDDPDKQSIVDKLKDNFDKIDRQFEEVRKDIARGIKELSMNICDQNMVDYISMIDLMDNYYTLWKRNDTDVEKYEDRYINMCCNNVDDCAPDKTLTYYILAVKKKLVSGLGGCAQTYIDYYKEEGPLEEYDLIVGYYADFFNRAIKHYVMCTQDTRKAELRINMEYAQESLDVFIEGREQVEEKFVNHITKHLKTSPYVYETIDTLYNDLVSGKWSTSYDYSLWVFREWKAWSYYHHMISQGKDGRGVIFFSLGNIDPGGRLKRHVAIYYKKRSLLSTGKKEFGNPRETGRSIWQRARTDTSVCRRHPLCYITESSWCWPACSDNCVFTSNCCSAKYQIDSLQKFNSEGYNKVQALPWYFMAPDMSYGDLEDEYGSTYAIEKHNKLFGSIQCSGIQLGLHLYHEKYAQYEWYSTNTTELGCTSFENLVEDFLTGERDEDCYKKGHEFEITHHNGTRFCAEDPSTWIGSNLIIRDSMPGDGCVRTWDNLEVRIKV